jgi:hypothetical protein
MTVVVYEKEFRSEAQRKVQNKMRKSMLMKNKRTVLGIKRCYQKIKRQLVKRK